MQEHVSARATLYPPKGDMLTQILFPFLKSGEGVVSSFKSESHPKFVSLEGSSSIKARKLETFYQQYSERHNKVR